MSKQKMLRLSAVASIIILSFIISVDNAQSAYEVWSCGNFNLQGYQDLNQLFNFILSMLR